MNNPNQDASYEIKIIHEEEDFLVLDKPAGIAVHPAVNESGYTITDFLAQHFPELQSVGEPWQIAPDKYVPRFGVAHRLDKDTSGALLVAKKENIWKYFKKLFKKRLIHKKYVAFVYGVIKDDILMINKPIARSPRDFRKFSAQKHARGTKKDALTIVHVKDRVGKGNEGFSFLEVYPKTGRTHQIRAHLSAIQRPIVCDKLYAPKKDCALGFSRQALHCLSLEFHDANKELRNFSAELPADFQEAIKQFEAKKQITE